MFGIYHLLKWNPQNELFIWQTCVVMVKVPVYLFTILCPFGTKESIRQKVDHGGQIVIWYY
jgi:hypothetical protein